ncbi:MAG: DsrE/DsrF/DrsH-like family protein [Deltaproteobacteria bacterium]|nr:DsrE/DsrF/DrsH-like family protein [Deltaproteobacteria bacterium]
MSDKQKKLVIIASKGTLDWAYPPFILASTAAAMDFKVVMFFTFYGLPLLMNKITAQVSPTGNPAMPMKMPFGFLEKFNLPIPNIMKSSVPGFEMMSTMLMKRTFNMKGVATIEELRSACVDSGARLLGCQMTMDVFGFKKEQFIPQAEIGGAATAIEEASDADISLFI